MPHLQTILIPRGDEHSMANLGTVFETNTWQLGAELHDARNRGYVSMGQRWKAILWFKAILELFKQISLEENRSSHTSMPILIYTSKLV